jgi:peptidyl-prolyl cis-trans isomerase D
MRSLAKYIWVLVALVFVGGFLLYETSGLMGRTPITPTTPVAVVNGHEIRYNDWVTRVQNEIQAQQQNQGRTLTQDDTRRIEQTVFDQMVAEVLLSQEYRRRHIMVTDDEIKEYARFAPPSWITTAPELQTEGRFDPEKYQRLLASPQARQGGLLVSLENYYRTEIPREKLFDQVAAGVYVTDAELWRAWRDQHDSAQVSYVAFRAALDTGAVKSISDSDIQKYFDAHKAQFQRQGRALLSVVTIPKTISAADTAAARERAEKLRAEIVGGAKFEDVAKRESADTVSGQQGGSLGRGGKNRFDAQFEKAAYALKVGEVSTPVLTPFGYHLLRVDEHKGDTLALRHILVRIQPSDSSASATDRRADELSTLAASTTGQPKKLDSAATKLGIPVQKVIAIEDEPATLNGSPVPSVSAWAFGGAHPGETSELFDDEHGYYLARLDTIFEGGEPALGSVREEVRGRLAMERKVDQLVGDAERFASAAAGTSLEDAATKQNLKVTQSPMFTRAAFVPGLGQYSEAVGAAFALPTGAVSAPVKTTEAVFVLRVDKRVMADSAAWAKQKDLQRQQRLGTVRQQKIQLFLEDLRKSAKLDDRRKTINATVRRADA